MQNWSTKDEIEMRIGIFQVSRDEIEVQIYRLKLNDKMMKMNGKNLHYATVRASRKWKPSRI